MNGTAGEQELKDRLELIENMIAQGRRSTESWGWSFVLWGVAYYVAIAWSSGLFSGPIWSQHHLAWPVTMIGTCLLNWLLASRMHKDMRAPETTAGRAIGASWIAMGISMFTLLFSMGISGRVDQQGCIAVIATMLGGTNAASGILLRWKPQIGCAVIWWLAAVASCFSTAAQSMVVFMVAIFICQILFGAYGMVLESRRKRMQGAANA